MFEQYDSVVALLKTSPHFTIPINSERLIMATHPVDAKKILPDGDADLRCAEVIGFEWTNVDSVETAITDRTVGMHVTPPNRGRVR